MIPLTLAKVNFDELNINNLSKRALLDSLKIFYKRDDMAYFEFLESKGINYYKNFKNIFELNNELNTEIKIFNDLASKEELIGFDFKASALLKRNLKTLTDNDYYKLNLDLRELNDNANLTKIKDIFLNLNSVSLVDFKEISEQRLSLVYNKRGASLYHNELILANARDNINLLENFKEAKDNNFIVARFILELALKLKEAGIDESFSYKFSSNGNEMIKSLDEIIYWGSLNKEEKEEQKAKTKEQNELNEKATQIAKKEIKEEINASRASLAKDSTNESLETQKAPVRLANIKTLGDELPHTQSKDQDLSSQERIEKIINESFELYHQKELEKTQIRLEKAKKDSFNAYDDLKLSLNNGLSIIEALKVIQQKYRNEDTINFASLLFSKDILNIKEKDSELKALKAELKSSYETQELLNDEITKREETISKLKGTVQVKVNEMTALKLEFEEEIESLKEAEFKFKELEKHTKEQDEIINELDTENQSLSDTNKALNEEKIKLEADNHFLQNTLKDYKEKENLYKQELLNYKELEKKMMGFELENQSLKAKEQSYKEELHTLSLKVKENYKQEFELEKLNLENEHLKTSLKAQRDKEQEYKEKIAKLESKLDSFMSQALKAQDEPKKELRSRDILGGV
ncbi:coiled-coil domain-containing protein [Campylobacter helveticus]|uniref:hypothetical protein n=1 Tax=Campylobacter helveticus TaxID=28898 RepID=UPI0009C2C8D7|nr:hypothetical protein [Campylobacter helveticus]ARE81388.1 hypothetical protein CHELV3228_a0013 [Campylobacter helveticus]TXK56452.1 hypothetical protein A9726_03140 [Campylobacter helveticus]SMC22285.1 hypothetical protein SAMN02745125_01355 [Campylobacter helveticus]SUW87712.1 Uncharacterised protein [Campylobacter helveticus]